MGLPLILLTLWWLPSDHLWCYAFVLLSSSAAAGSSRLLELGAAQNYEYTSTVLLNDGGELGKSVGYQIAGDVSVAVVWESSAAKLLRMEVSVIS